jgi:HEPN domain-containing protein
MNLTVKAFADDAIFDLGTAILLLENNNWKYACLGARQAIEKISKCILLNAGIDIYDLLKCHQITDLYDKIQRLSLHQFSDEDKENALTLTSYSNQKYPDEDSARATYLEFTKTGAVRAIQWAFDYADILDGRVKNIIDLSARNELRKSFHIYVSLDINDVFVGKDI